MEGQKLFNKWDCGAVQVLDPGLRKYITLENTLIPYSFGLHTYTKFARKNVHIVERLANDLMVTGHVKDNRVHRKTSGRDTGKKQRVFRAIEDTLQKIEDRTKKNPVEVLVRAVETIAPREETTRLRRGGIIVHRPVDVSPQRRLDTALRFMVHGAAQRTFKSKKKLSTALAEEIIAASNNDNSIYSIKKKDELERVAASAR